MVFRNKLQMIFAGDELRRISVRDDFAGNVLIIADVHGMSLSKARRFINNIINVIQTAFKLLVIHGYVHGTAIKEMLTNEFHNGHVSAKYPSQVNKGVTYLVID